MADSSFASSTNSGGTPVQYGAGHLPATIGTSLAIPPLAGPAAGPDLSVSEIWRILSKWRRLILGAAVVGMLVGLAVTLLMTPMYRGTATLEIGAPPVQVVQMGSVEAPQQEQANDAEYMATQLGLMQSRSLAERVVRQLNLANDPTIVDQDLPRAAREQGAIGYVAANFIAEPVKYSRLVKLNFQSPNRATAARVANGYADNFIASGLERRYETTAYARNFLEQRLAAVKARLEESERALVDYARQQGIVIIGGDTSTTGSSGDAESGGGAAGSTLDSSTLVALNAALAQATTDRIAAQQRYEQAKSSHSTSELYQSAPLQALRQKRDDLQAQYDQNLIEFKPELPAMVKLKAQIDTISKEIRGEATGASSAISGDYAAAVARERELQAKVNQLKANLLDLRGRSIQYNILQREVDTNRTLYDGLLQRFKEVGIAAGVGENTISIVDRARQPGGPFRPILWLNLAIGLFAGLILGVATALGIEFIDDTIATPEDLEQKLGLTSLGVIPMVPKTDSFVEQLSDPKSATTEAHYSVRTALQFATETGVPNSLLITSSQAGEGKSSTALALSQNFAGSGKRVLLVDADLRKPTFRTKSEDIYGLSNLLTGDDLVEKAIHKTSIENLYILPSGHIPPNPAELVSGHRMRELLNRLTEVFDLVVLDGPPVLGLADAPLLGSIAAGTLLVLESGVVRRPAAANSVNRLRGANARLIGGVLTKYSERFGAAGYGYGYGYGAEAYSYGQRDELKMIDLAVVE